MVNRYFQIVNAGHRLAVASWHIFFFILKKEYESKSKDKPNPEKGSKTVT